MAEEVTLAFACRAETWIGQNVRVTGNTPELGMWNPALAPALTTDASEYPKWSGNIQCTAVPTEYKFVKWDDLHQSCVWEEGENRYFAVNDEGVVTRSGESGESSTPIFGVKDPCYVPRLASGRSRKTSFDDEVQEYAVPIPETPRHKLANRMAGKEDPEDVQILNFCGIFAFQSREEKSLRLGFACRAETWIGQNVRVTGDTPELGMWNPALAPALTTYASEYPKWFGIIQCTAVPTEYKFVKWDDLHQSCVWEEGENRYFGVTDEGVVTRSGESGKSSAPIFGVKDPCYVPRLASGRSRKISFDDEVQEYAVPIPETPTHKLANRMAGKEDPEDVQIAFQFQSSKEKKSLRPAKRRFSAPPACGELLRRRDSLSALPGTSLSLLSEGVPVVAQSWWRCRDLSGPPLKEQCVSLKLQGIEECEAKKLSVEVVFKANSLKPALSLELTSLDAEGLQAIWSLAVTAAELQDGIHFFHFRVNGVFALSCEHIRVGRWNALHCSDQICRYLLARDRCGQLLEEGEPFVEKTRSSQMREMKFDPVVGDASSADTIGLQEFGGQIARPYSVCGQLAVDSNECDNEDGANSIAPFSKEIYEGLFDRGMMLHLDGVVLPEVPLPPLALEDTGCALRLWAGAHMIQKAHGACEDAFFMDPHGLGVADGVGCMVQFAKNGVNAAKYAAELMEFSSAALKPGGIASEEKIPNDVVERAKAAVQHAESQAVAYGASTVAVLCQQGNSLGVANLGDSGFMVLRKGPHGMFIVIKSEEQQHHWNCPYQLTRLPQTLWRLFRDVNLDTASDCQGYNVTICEGDLVIMFSDGLRDNLHDHEVVSLVNRTLPPMCADLVGLLDRCTPPETIAKRLAEAAHERSMDELAKVPFVEYSKRHGFSHDGGKQDDITVVAAWVVADESQPNPDAVDVDELIEEMAVEEERVRLKAKHRKEKEERLRLEAEDRLRKEERLRLEEEERLREEKESLLVQAFDHGVSNEYTSDAETNEEDAEAKKASRDFERKNKTESSSKAA